MEELNLSETLLRYFSDVFLCCDEEKSGNASLAKTVELIKSGKVPDDVIAQISEVCWDENASSIDRKQFFTALKLVAAYQADIPIKTEVVTSDLELPLPKFTWNTSESDLIELTSEKSDFVEANTDSEAESDTLSIIRNGSPEVSSATSDSPTPTNSVQDRSWAWHGLVSEEQRQLLGTEEESSDRHSSDEDTEVGNEIWTINSEQRDYYTKQFRSLQSDTDALLAGPLARMFFEKSRLPVHELRKIWQLADVTKDGALSLQEFNTAMHLVVLRRNHIELPDTLPVSLVPGNETPVSVSPETEPILSPQTKDTAKEWTKFVDSPTSSIASPGPKPVNFNFQKVTLDKDSKILHPVPLRLTPECASVSGGAAAVAGGNGGLGNESDDVDCENQSPKRFAELAAANNGNSAIQRPQPKKVGLVPGPGAIPPPPQNNQGSAPNSSEPDGPVSLPAFPPPKKEKPPPPPPRPFKTHGRSSSLDLNRLTKLGAPPSVPPRTSPNIQSGRKLVNQRSEGDYGTHSLETRFTPSGDCEQYENVPKSDVYDTDRRKLFGGPRKHGAFEVYRKPPKPHLDAEGQAKWNLLQKLQEQNGVLVRICQELSQELADVREEKLGLLSRLDKQNGQTDLV